MKKFFLVIVALALLQACAATPRIDRRLADATEKNRGIVLFTCTHSGQHGAMVPITLKFRAVGSGTTEKVSCDNKFDYLTGERAGVLILPATVFSKENPVGSIIALDLPAGEYEFFSYSGELYVQSGMVTSYSRIRSRPDLSIRFVVSSDRQNYIGNLNFDYLSGKFKFEVLDQRDRDVPHLKNRLPETGSRDIGVDLMKVQQPSISVVQ